MTKYISLFNDKKKVNNIFQGSNLFKKMVQSKIYVMLNSFSQS